MHHHIHLRDIDQLHREILRFLVSLNLEETYKVIVDGALKLVEGDSGSILLGKKGGLKRVYASSEVLFKVKPRRRGIVYGVFKTCEPRVLSAKEIRDVEKRHPALKELPARSILLIPLSYLGKSMGVLTVLSKEDIDFTQKEFNMLKLFGTAGSLAIRKAQLYQQTREALETRDLFISLAAHELRTPLTTINGYVQLLAHKLSGDSVEASWTDGLKWEIKRLTRMVNELLDVQLIKTGQFICQKHKVSLKDVARRAILESKFAYPKHKFGFEDDLGSKPDILEGDPDKLVQVVANLLDNAAKFSLPGQKILVRLRSNHSSFVIEVQDHGLGIEGKEASQVFSRFYKGQNNYKRGMGLGLFLAKQIVECHDGSINLKSEVNKGTKIFVVLPKS
ncbi:MAG: GAF domain-containing sensor histidine kinase [Candidatus Blackburnbacteria bacterium]|nr:GAF domain-containing sensor histidine kinase [Candidatus Blackburnbacteria bacterium]